ncbi:hypothetical protein AB1Y20_005698 [Prymnesium parvum]|uniref:Uncharacterized protein n=1 Tax=Prymnesium parvum TaxID=97485 RepID=A0AB34J1S4_PRYPA|mmetsp:Transcript_38954/g.96778  ORF Transcript_38954/g.96778 Transcript_38954/m.96778 type:complete len:203 (+) Transcript_38954:104-712(+)|eukprot:CAMPEP_0182819466 /NCGR_PEP_ID=MMETSP0006_2-20121128/12593_1 /TAXON_ID=97485 /ORGANISM="Prymnesium parvum, Strain Texoma1" /LENGTH=202 /DNA_ID=CAMNT_0024946041 /DNA_START=105 /DNA_END=713 /DNA_ORIENTATION=+
MAEPVVCDPALLAGCKLGNVSSVMTVLAKSKEMVNTKSATKQILPIQVAAGFTQPEVVKVLLENGANAQLQDACGLTAVHVAAAKENLEVLQLLLSDPKGKECANIADEDGSTPLHHAAYVGLKANVEELLKAGAQDIPDNNGKTAATEAMEKGFDEIAQLIGAGTAAGDDETLSQAPDDAGEAAPNEEEQAPGDEDAAGTE